MWSSDSPFRQRTNRSIRICSLTAITMLLSACIQPLYRAESTDNVGGKLKQISIEPLPDLLGHYLETELIFLLNGTGENIAPKYRLTITPHESNTAQVVDSLTGRADSASVLVTADFKLVAITGGKLIASGQVTSAATYDRSNQRFANLRAARDGQIRDAKSLAQDIKNRIAATFVTDPGL